MTDRIDELQGQIKKGIGSLTGNGEPFRIIAVVTSSQPWQALTLSPN